MELLPVRAAAWRMDSDLRLRGAVRCGFVVLLLFGCLVGVILL